VVKILEAGSAIVLFDGLDEVRQEHDHREATIGQMRDFTNKYLKAQCLITCRIAATSYSFDRFRYVELADFTDKQIETYASKWFHDQPEKSAQFFAEFEREENRNLREMARTPLLLGLLCLAFDATMSFPRRRVELYEEAIEALLKKWDASRAIKRDEIYQGLSLGRKRQMFARIAADTFEANQYFLSERKLAAKVVDCLVRLPDSPPRADIDGVAALKAIEAQHGIFCERAKEVYSFAHLTFQEYFAARFIVENTNALKRLTKEQRVADPRWREVALLTASLLNDADEYLTQWRQSADAIVQTDPELCNLFKYAHSMALPNGDAIDLELVRAFYCFLPFNLIYQDVSLDSSWATVDLNLIQARSKGDIKIAQQIEHDDSTAQAIYHTRALILDLIATLDLRLARTIDKSLPSRARNFSRIKGINLIGAINYTVPFSVPQALHHGLSSLVDQAKKITENNVNSLEGRMQVHLHLTHMLGHSISYCWWDPIDENLFAQYIKVLASQANRLSLTSLGQSLNSLAKIKKPRSKSWKEFTETLQLVTLEETKIPAFWTPTNAQCTKLISYFGATLLFLEALEVAAVSDRKQIRGNLLAPPWA